MKKTGPEIIPMPPQFLTRLHEAELEGTAYRTHAKALQAAVAELRKSVLLGIFARSQIRTFETAAVQALGSLQQVERRAKELIESHLEDAVGKNLDIEAWIPEVKKRRFRRGDVRPPELAKANEIKPPNARGHDTQKP